MTKTKHPNKGHSPNNGQRPMYQSVRYSETPLYLIQSEHGRQWPVRARTRTFNNQYMERGRHLRMRII